MVKELTDIGIENSKHFGDGSAKLSGLHLELFSDQAVQPPGFVLASSQFGLPGVQIPSFRSLDRH